MKTLVVTSGKGGVGKTTLALNIARQLSLAGCRTLIVDFDIHNKGTTGLFLDRLSEASPSILDVVRKSNGFAPETLESIASETELIQLADKEELFLFPATRPRELIRWEQFVEDVPQMVEFFRGFFRRLGEQYGLDVVVIDCYGGIDTLTVAATGVADDTIIVNEPNIITFSGTLMLYSHLAQVYQGEERAPRIHFVINRVTARYGYRFLEAEYKKHLAPLGVDRAILAYFPFDKLILETFGDSPFYTELLPKSLVTRKIRLLIATLWPDRQFKARFGLPERRAEKIHRMTSELGFADPDRTLRSAVTCLLWLLIPVTILILLSQGVGGRLSFDTIRVGYLGSLCGIAVVLAMIGEPILDLHELVPSEKA